jgi:hypothetical protein
MIKKLLKFSLYLTALSISISTVAEEIVTIKGGLEKRTCPSDMPVKGNINSFKNTKIYHLPGDAFYERTNPEACFKNSAEAESAGFRSIRSN